MSPIRDRSAIFLLHHFTLLSLTFGMMLSQSHAKSYLHRFVAMSIPFLAASMLLVVAIAQEMCGKYGDGFHDLEPARCLCEMTNGSTLCYNGGGYCFGNVSTFYNGGNPGSVYWYPGCAGYVSLCNERAPGQPFSGNPVAGCVRVLGFCDPLKSNTTICCNRSRAGVGCVLLSDNDWLILQNFFTLAGCNSTFCRSFATNRACTAPLICDALGNVLQLQLDRYNLSGSLSTELAQLTSLNTIVFSNNAFNSTIPAQFSRLSSLTLLDLSYNGFVGSVPQEFDRLNVKSISLHGNKLTGLLPIFPKASKCSLSVGNDNNFCCPKGSVQPCCSGGSCQCVVSTSCPLYATSPTRCALMSNDSSSTMSSPDYALCMTASTLDDEERTRLGDDSDLSRVLIDNFTIAFWAFAREPLNFTTLAPSLANATTTMPTNGLLFASMPQVTANNTNSNSGAGERGLGFYLGTDGFTIEWRSRDTVSPIVIQRQPLIGWHHYSIVYNNGEAFVYLDGIDREAAQSKVIDRSKRVGFCLTFARTRFRFTVPTSATGFEGWISELRLANRAIHGSEALEQSNNASAWTYSYPMRGCSGENHKSSSELEPFKLQQAWLVCVPPPTTTSTTTTTTTSTTSTTTMSTSPPQTTTNNVTIVTTMPPTLTISSSSLQQSTTSVSTLMTTTTIATTNNDTTVAPPMMIVDSPPIWIFAAAGGGVAALLLLIGAVALACWCNKRAAAVIPPSTGTQMTMLSNDTNMASFRQETSQVQQESSSQRSSQYAAMSFGGPSNEYGAAPSVGGGGSSSSHYSSPSDVVVPPPMQHYRNYTDQLPQLNQQLKGQYGAAPTLK